VIAALRSFAGHLIVDGYGAYQRLLTRAGAVLAGIQQCCAHVMRRCRGVAKLGPGTLQSSWTGEVTRALAQAHAEVESAKARRETALDPDRLAALRERYDRAVDTGRVEPPHYCGGPPSGPYVHVSAHTAQADRQSSSPGLLSAHPLGGRPSVRSPRLAAGV
jgi:hypothetical protein